MSSDQKETELLKEYEINLEMWRHYDNLRQEKNRTFLTVNTILVAAMGFALKDQLVGPVQKVVALLVVLVSVLGILACVLWFLLLSRNSAYVKFHRDRIKALEPKVSPQFATFTKQHEALEGSRLVWEKLSSSVIDRLLATFVAAFWLVLLIVSSRL